MQKDIKVKISITFIIIGLILAISNSVVNDYKKSYEKEKTELFIQNISDNINDKASHLNNTSKDNDYIAVLEIPKIGLRKGLHSPNSKNNNVNKNITILNPIQMPNKNKSTLILASHSGNSKVSYFNSLNKLRNNDKVYVYYKGIKYKYIINNYYEEKKTGRITIKSNSNKKVIVLTTCKPISFNKQLVYIGYLYDEETL